MNSIINHRIFLQIFCVLILFSGNSLLAFQPKLLQDSLNTPNKTTIGFTITQNTSFRNYIEDPVWYTINPKELLTEIRPSISIGVHIEKFLSKHSHSSSLKFRLLYEKFNSTLSQERTISHYLNDTSNHTFQYYDVNQVTQISLQTLFVQRLFSTNLSLKFGGTISFIQSNLDKKYYVLNSIRDTMIFSSTNSNNYYVNQFSEDYTEYISSEFNRSPDLRLNLNIGLQYDFVFEKCFVTPFVNYYHDFDGVNREYELQTLQAGVDFSFPIR